MREHRHRAATRWLRRLAAGALAATLALGGAVLSTGTAQAAPGDGPWSASGDQLVDAAGNEVRMTGLNWFGFETDTFAPHGLWARNYQDMLDQVKELGYNTLRLPFSNQLFDAGARPNGIDFSRNPDLQGLTGLQIMDRIIGYAGDIGLKVLLDRHRPDATGQSALWYTSAYPEQRWINDWVMLANRYRGDDTVIGADLHNEPRNPATWGSGDQATDWRLAAERAGNAILAANPDWLIVVEGIECYSGNCNWWGGNLMGAREHPVRLSNPDKLVYSAHEYATSVFDQPWFSDPAFPENLPARWEQYWGYLETTGTAPVLLGEFGSTLTAVKDQQWLARLMRYLGTGTGGIDFTYWSLNPNSGDTGGILNGDWTTVDTTKQAYLTPYLLPVGDGGSGPGTPVPTVRCRVTYQIGSSWNGGYQANVTLANTDSSALNGWSLAWTFRGNERIASGWNATFAQSGSLVTATNAAYNATIAPGGSVSVGFTVTSTGSPQAPTAFAVNGTACT